MRFGWKTKKSGKSTVMLEALEDRRLLSTATLTGLVLSRSASDMGQDVTFTATVTPQGSGTPTGFVRFMDSGTLVAKIALSGSNTASYDEYAFFKGTHSITAKYVGDNNFAKSASTAQALQVVKGTFQPATGDGLKIATVTAGTGPGAAEGDSLQMNYTGYLTDGTKFDSSLNSGRSPFDVTIGTTSLIQGFTEGLIGMQVGETRIILIPPAEGYGRKANGPIPANSTLIFVVTLESIS